MNCIALAVDDLEQVAELYGRLMTGAAGLPNDELFARMLTSQAAANGMLPAGLGLHPEDYVKLLVRHFPDVDLSGELPPPVQPEESRLTERQDLVDLLLEFRANADQSEIWMAEIVAAACMGGDHLWQDLGLWMRADLSRLMVENFPPLAAKNDRDMKWKKFLYRQICDREGVYLCPAPSCQACVDYAKCFSSEE
jgi:nitrogen fixation protein NifQ